MTVAIALVTHPGIATAMRKQAAELLGVSLDEIHIAELDSGTTDPRLRLAERLASYDRGDGVLILTDLPGATPSNRAREALPRPGTIISGLNMPMLIRAWNYRDRPLDELRELVMEGGRKAIMEPD
jgi:mannose/fructose-specific phosphotransferase system component IIA